MDQENIILTIPEDTSYICPNINLGQLPAFLEKAVTVTDQPLQQDMLLLSALTACSYAMPNIRIAHGFPTHYYHPSLMALVIAPPASGKGIMNLSRRLVMPIHEQRRNGMAPTPCGREIESNYKQSNDSFGYAERPETTSNNLNNIDTQAERGMAPTPCGREIESNYKQLNNSFGYAERPETTSNNLSNIDTRAERGMAPTPCGREIESNYKQLNDSFGYAEKPETTLNNLNDIENRAEHGMEPTPGGREIESNYKQLNSSFGYAEKPETTLNNLNDIENRAEHGMGPTPGGRELTAFIPSNSSSAAFLKLLHDNDGRGLMMETEADALTAAWKNDFANYSYAMRQAAEHETITKARKKAGEAYLEIRDPELSVLLSGTLNQLAPLLVSRENGLASRFVCYMAEEIFPFDERAIHGQSSACDNSAEQLYDTLGDQLLRLYNMLLKRKTPIDFILSDTQAEGMRSLFLDSDTLTMEDMHLPVSFSPVVKRMAVHVMRMGAILSVLRAYERLPEGGTLPDSLLCHDDDFRTMMLLAEQLLIHAGRTYLALPSDDATTVTSSEPQAKSDELLSLLPERFTTAEAIEAGKGMNLKERSIYSYLSDYQENKQIKRLNKGSYIKI